MLYAIIARTTVWLLAAQEWDASTFDLHHAHAGMLQTVRSFLSLVSDGAQCLYFNKTDTLALRDI